MAAAEAAQRAQKEKQYAQERNYGGGFGSQHAQEPQTVQDTDTTLGWKLLRILNAGS